jgi:drug/metabolite transporter (DMT)-like permease
VLSHLAAIPVIIPFLFLVPGQPGKIGLLWGAAAGVASLVGVVALNLGLASAAMATVAPVAAVTAALVPMIGGLLLGERPAFAAIVGGITAVLAILMVSSGGNPGGELLRVQVVGLALISGVAFGLFFLLLGQAGPEAGMWPLIANKVTSVALGLIVLQRVGLSRLTAVLGVRQVVLLAMLAGVFDTIATALYLLSAHSGHVSIVAPVAALYPASTVMLALIFNRERLQLVPFAGLGLAGVALVLAAT